MIKVFFEKLIVTKYVNWFHASLKQQVSSPFSQTPIIRPYPEATVFSAHNFPRNLALKCTLNCSTWLFLQVTEQSYICISRFPHSCYMPAHLIFFELVTVGILVDNLIIMFVLLSFVKQWM